MGGSSVVYKERVVSKSGVCWMRFLTAEYTKWVCVGVRHVGSEDCQKRYSSEHCRPYELPLVTGVALLTLSQRFLSSSLPVSFACAAVHVILQTLLI